MFDIPCIILAGGKSSRMGEDKSLLPFAGFETLAEFQLSRLKKIFKIVYISCKSRDKFNFNANFIEDTPTDNVFAPTMAFVSIFNTLTVKRVFILSVDTPFVNYRQIKKLIESDTMDVDATIAKTDLYTHPLCGVYHSSLKNSFKEMLQKDSHKLGFLLKSSKTQYISFHNEIAFTNLNNPTDYTKALKILK